MISSKNIVAAIVLLVLLAEYTNGQTCSHMWDPVFETDSANLPAMCPVTTTSGASCVFPFNSGGITYRTCTIAGPNNPNFRPQCAISVDSNNTAVAWSFCQVPNDAVIFFSTVRKGGYWTENAGSTQGGTMLWIYGSRFAQNGFDSVPSVVNSNTVQLADNFGVYNCEMHTDKTTNTQLTCYTPTLPESVYQIRVYVNGNLIPLYQYVDPNRAVFISSASQTPTITGITPQSGTPQSLIALTGAFRTACYARDVEGCAQDNNPLISRIYLGGHLCNVVNQLTGTVYNNVTDTSLQCNFEGTEIGIFNVSMLVTNQYGRSFASPSLYRVSAEEDLYTFQSYAVISSVAPSAGSTAGGTTLTITGNYFDTSAKYPLKVNVGGEPCTILHSTLTTIHCQTPVQPASIASQYQGGRGLQVYRTSGSNSQATLSSASPPAPTGTVSWTDDALFVSDSTSAETIWLVGFIRVLKTSNYTFTLDTNGAAALFVSTDASPANKQLVADATNNQSSAVQLNNNTNYYLFCVGSRSSGLRLGVQVRMHSTKLTAGTSSLVANEIQRISVTRSIVSEQQQIAYNTNSINGTSEVQSIAVDSSTFLIGFRGVYTAVQTGRPSASAIEAALNDLPTIAPLQVTVSATSTLYMVTFPPEMGDVPLLTCVSTSPNAPVVIEVVQGVASGSKIAFALDGQLTDYIDYTGNVTEAQIYALFNSIFGIQCPPSIIDPTIRTVVYARDFESNCVYDETPVTTNAFCGQCSLNGNTVVSGNTGSGNILCFAYRVLNDYVTTISMSYQTNGDTTSDRWASFSFVPQADRLWHYTCIDVRARLLAQSSIDASVSSLVIRYAWLINSVRKSVFLDAISIRTAFPSGYETTTSYPVDQSANKTCVFPFNYNGKRYQACTLDNNNVPICADRNNVIYQCAVTSIEGARRLYPKHQLSYNTLAVTYAPLSSQITITFRYSDCQQPTQFVPWPSTSATVSSLATASSAASGTYDLVFNGRTYSSISVDISSSDLAARLQSSPDFGFLNVQRQGDCTRYSYTIEWLANGGQKSSISISNAASITPAGTTVTASVVQSGGVLYKPLTGDLTRIYNTNPQVEVFVGGYPSRCIGSGTCDFQWSSIQTPTVTNVVQNSMTLTITGTGFSTTASSNTVIIGTSGVCTVTAASATSLTCTISAAPAGTYGIEVNVADKGFATGTASFTVTITLQVSSISPTLGGAGGGYILNVTGTGFASSSVVTVDGSPCTNSKVINFSLISCTVPPTAVVSNTQVSVAVTSGASTQTSPISFTYDVTNTPSITSSSPSAVTMAGGQLTIVGTNFGSSSVTVYIGSAKANVRSLSSTQIIADLPSMAPGLYPILVSTPNGYARPAIEIEYRFCLQSVYSHVGSLYGGNHIYVQGQGFDNTTKVSFTDGTNSVPCNVLSFQSDQIHCQTDAAAPRAIISATGIDPVNGPGFAWSPQYATVQQGAVVEWKWGSSALLSSLTYKVQQVSSGYSTVLSSGGFDSGNASASGSFTFQFQTVGTYYYYTPAVDSTGLISMRGVINVVAAQPQTLTAQATSGSYAAQTCAFPFTFNSNTYTACTTDNDTQPWCSPTPVYTGQRIYCTPTATVPTPTACVSSTLLNPSSCSQMVPTNSLEFLFTPCTMGTVSSISPTQGPTGTTITITGTGFSSTTCENVVLIGSNYECPITSATSTQIVCQIGANSLLNAKSIQNVNVARDRQGFLSNDGLIQFQFQAEVTAISPSQGSTAGGTLVTITGDGFTPADTRVIVGDIEYTSFATITYTQIQFITQVPPASYINQAIPIKVLVGTNEAICSSAPCTYQWAQSATPSLTSVSPTSITGPQTLTLTGQNFDPTNSLLVTDVTVTINGTSCTVTGITNTAITCNIGSIEVGAHLVAISIDGIGSVLSSTTLTSVASISSVSPTSGSTFGGAVLTINGNGFSTLPSNVQVTVGTGSCSVLQTTPAQIQCLIPPQASSPASAAVSVVSNGVTFPSSSSYTYSAASTPTVSSINPTSGTSGQLLVISGSNFVTGQSTVTVGGVPCVVTSDSSTSITCTVGSSPAGNQPVIVTVPTVGRSNSNVQFAYTLQVSSATPSQGSYGGGQSVTVNGDGFNTSTISVTICGQACRSVTVLSNTQLTCVTPSATVSSSNTPCTLVVTVGSLSQNVPYTYDASLTATVTAINPTRGGTGGGTLLTVTGTNFPTSLGAVTVSIAGVPCTVQSVSTTAITCLTGSYSQTTVQAPVIVNVVNGGNAIGSAQFEYIDLWSSPWTWGGSSPPEEGTIVSIDSGKTVYFDAVTPILKALIVDNASLIFDDNQDVALNVEYILVVNGGRLQVGTESTPFQHNAVITMYGSLRSIELPIYGAKVLALRDGTVDMHGKNVGQTWTRLAATAAIGATQITLQQSVSWPVGGEIVVTTTGNFQSQGQTETRTITAISSNGLTLTLNAPLTYQHLGVTQTIGSTPIEFRAEVGLLSRNIVFRGSTASSWNEVIEACPDTFRPGEFAVQTCFLGRYGQEIGSDQFGATIMASSSLSTDAGSTTQRAILRLSNIEVTNAGQAFRLGRYPVHFHMNGNMSSSYIRSSSIHHTFNRAVNVHATHFLTIENNVVYNVMGGALFLEDGVEIGNTLRGNLVVFVRTSSSLLNEDVTPAAFWVTNPNNIVENNAVAGGTHFGYWYRMLETPDGPSFAMFRNFCPDRQPFGRFVNNSVHSVGRFGVWIFPEYGPTVAGSCTNDAPLQAVFDGLISWNNDRGYEWVMSSSVQLKNAVVYDNADTGIRCVTAVNHQSTNLPNLRATFYNENTGSSVIDSLVIGDSGVSGTPVVPFEGGLVVMWDRGLVVRNISFYNFPSPNTQAIFGPVIAGRCVVFCGGWMTKFSQLSFTNVLNRGNFRWAYDGVYQDVDGTLANTPGGMILPPDGLWTNAPACTQTPNFVNAVTCPGSMGTWIRFAFNKASLGQNGEVLNVYDSANRHSIVPNAQKRLTHPKGYMMTLLAKKTYLFQFQNALTSVNLSYTGVAYSLAPGDYLIIRHAISYMPDRVNTVWSTRLVSQSSAALTAASDNGDWYYDNTTNEFTYIVKNPSTSATTADVTINLNVVKCRYPNCEPPAQPGLELPATARPATALYWSNNSHWYFATEGFGGSNGAKPGDNTHIYIPRGIWLVVDYTLPIIRSLRIDGVLEFEQGMNNILRAESILINGGQLIVGWPNNPLTSNVDIIITGSPSVNLLLPNDGGSLGPRAIGVLGGLDLHGLPRPVSWTRLATTAAAGQTSITLSEAVNWLPGEEVLLTTTDTRINHAERRTIATVTGGGTVIGLTSALTYTHIVIHKVFPNGEVYHVAGAVGLLTRNVRVMSQSPSTEKIGFRVFVTSYMTDIWNPVGNEYLSTFYKGYARISNTQFMNYGQFVDAAYEDKRDAIHMYDLGDWNASRPSYVDSCSFDTGYYTAIGVWDTNGVPITNNLVYNTYESAIVTNGKNNIIQKNLVSTVFWSGAAEPDFASFNTNWDGAVMTRDATSVTMKDNLVSGVQRIAYRIQGNSCPGTVLPTDIINDYDNNEAHSSMTGAVMWPVDTGFPSDTSCVLIKGFKTYKTWYYGLYINTPRNIIIDSCVTADSGVGILAFKQSSSPLSHVFVANTIDIRNCIVIGDITQDCTDLPDTTTVSEVFGFTCIPHVSGTAVGNGPDGRVGISFPYFSGDNMVPRHPWSSVGSYPALGGLMTIVNVTYGFFNNTCSRRDIAVSVSQENDDGQHPVVSSQVKFFNSSMSNVIFNGRPNLRVVNPSDCVDMDCDGLKKALLTDTDGTIFGQPSSIFSESEYDWGDQQHGVGDFRIPSAALAGSNGQMININTLYPYRGISRAPSCVYQPSYQMWLCPNTVNYRMLIIESMDADTETRRLSPVAIMSDSGYIDLINGPQDHGWCNGYTCQKRISTFMAIIQSGHHYDIYLSSTTPNHIRFRFLNADPTIRASLALNYQSLQQVDVYANSVYVSPTNKDNSFTQFLMLLDQSNGVTLSSTPGSNFFNRTTRMTTFLIDGATVIDLKISQLIVLTFGLPATTPSAFFTTNLVSNLAALLGVTPDKIRRVNIISGTSDVRLYRRQTLLNTIQLRVEIRDDPPPNLPSGSSSSSSNIAQTTASIINRFQSQTLQAAFATYTGSSSLTLSVQEPENQTTVDLSVIDRLVLVTPPSSCRLQSACDIQPVLVAYDTSGNIIQKLGSNDQPWQVVATVISPVGVQVIGAIANYTNGKTQYTLFGLTSTGSVQVNFSFISPYGVAASFVASVNLVVTAPSLTVANPSLAAQQYINIDVVSVNDTFNLSSTIVDRISKKRVGNIVWGSFTWTATASLYTAVQYQSNGLLTASLSSAVVVDTTAGTITATNLAINEPGMYVVKMQITSSNNLYSIILTSNAILVKRRTTTLETYQGTPPSNIIFKADYYALQASGQLEMFRCALYNYLVFVLKMPIVSDIQLRPGSVGAYFGTSAPSAGASQNLASAVNSLITNTNALSGATVQTLSINGKSYSASGGSSENYGQTNNTALIVGLVVGILGAVLLIAGTVFGFKQYHKKKRGQRLVNDEFGLESSSTNNVRDTRTMPTNGPRPPTNNPNMKRRVSASVQTAPIPHPNRAQATAPAAAKEERVPSAAMSVTMLDIMTPGNQQAANKPMQEPALIKFD